MYNILDTLKNKLVKWKNTNESDNRILLFQHETQAKQYIHRNLKHDIKRFKIIIKRPRK